METFIVHFGYLAVLLGTFLEGETVLALGGFAAHRGYLDLSLVILAGLLGTLSGDQLFYYLGRRHSRKQFLEWPSWRSRLSRAHEKIERRRILIILGFRFLHGVRTVTPYALGMAGISPKFFVPLNFLGAVIWSVVVGSAGYFFGHVLEKLFGQIKQVELWIMIGIAIAGGLVWSFHFFRSRRKRL